MNWLELWIVAPTPLATELRDALVTTSSDGLPRYFKVRQILFHLLQPLEVPEEVHSLYHVLYDKRPDTVRGPPCPYWTLFALAVFARKGIEGRTPGSLLKPKAGEVLHGSCNETTGKAILHSINYKLSNGNGTRLLACGDFNTI